MSIILDAPQSQSTMETFAALAQEFRCCLSAYVEDPLSKSIYDSCIDARRKLALFVSNWPKNEKQNPELIELREIIEKIAASGLWDLPAEKEDTALLESIPKKGWSSLLATMVLVPAFQWPEAPRIQDVPLFLWDAYSAYLFYAPTGFTEIGQAEQYGRHALKRLEELCQLAQTNRGSAAVKVALESYVLKGSCIPLYFTSNNLRRHYELRGKILSLASGVGIQDAMLPLPREGRRLKIGFLNRHFAPQTETYTTIPSFEQLDPERFEVRVFALRQSGTPLETYTASKVPGGINYLPESLDGQLALLRNEALDVLVFGTNVTAVYNEVTRLALYRIAPLQVVNNSSCTTTGLPEVDVYVSGSLAETEKSPEHYSERLALLPGPAHAFNYEADAVAASGEMTRAALQIPEGVPLFVTASNFYKIIPEMMDCWAELLSRVPNSYLLIHPFNPNWSSQYPVKRFTQLFEQALKRWNVDDSRFVLSTIRFPSRTDVGAMLGLGDVYLDSYPFGGVNSIIDPLQHGVPVVEWEGDCFRSRMGSAVLRQLGLDECCATDRDSYLNLCVKLATDSSLRASLRERINHSMQRIPIFFDMLAASDAFGELMNIAFDELCAKGNVEFRKDRSVIAASLTEDPATLLSTSSYLMEIGMTNEAVAQVNSILASIPNHTDARQRMARILSAAGRHDRSVEYLLAIVQSASASALHWRELSTEFRHVGNGEGARQALEASLRMDPSDVETWLVLGDLAWESRHEDILNEVLGILPQVAPDDPRVKAFIERGKLPSEPSAS